jgi:hypothetical protein
VATASKAKTTQNTVRRRRSMARVADQLLLTSQVQLLEPLGEQVVGADPGAERAPAEQAQSTKTVAVPMNRLTMMCLCASITCSAELRSIRWKPTKREAVSAPSRIWMSSQNEKVNNRLTKISTAQRRLRHLWHQFMVARVLRGDAWPRSRPWSCALAVHLLRGRRDRLRLLRRAPNITA